MRIGEERLLSTPCSHTFHAECLDNWMRSKGLPWEQACIFKCHESVVLEPSVTEAEDPVVIEVDDGARADNLEEAQINAAMVATAIAAESDATPTAKAMPTALSDEQLALIQARRQQALARAKAKAKASASKAPPQCRAKAAAPAAAASDETHEVPEDVVGSVPSFSIDYRGAPMQMPPLLCAKARPPRAMAAAPAAAALAAAETYEVPEVVVESLPSFLNDDGHDGGADDTDDHQFAGLVVAAEGAVADY
jgi:hypothetical protein